MKFCATTGSNNDFNRHTWITIVKGCRGRIELMQIHSYTPTATVDVLPPCGQCYMCWLILVARLADKFIEGPLKETLQLNGIDLSKDWTAISGSEGGMFGGNPHLHNIQR